MSKAFRTWFTSQHTLGELIGLVLVALTISTLAPDYARVMGIMIIVASVRFMVPSEKIQFQLSCTLFILAMMTVVHGLVSYLFF